MTYPNRYSVLTNFPREEELTDVISTTAMQAEYTRVAESISQIITTLRKITTSDGRLKLDQAVRLRDVIQEDAWTGDGTSDTFTWTLPIDAAVDLVRVFVDDVRVDPVSVTDTEVQLPDVPAGGAEITALIYMNLAGVLDRLQSVVTDEGASMTGIADVAERFTADNVEDALAEDAENLASLITAIGDLSNYLFRDGTRTLTGQWEVNDRTEVTIAPAVAVGAFRVNANPADEDYVQINDGVLTVKFEFDNDAAVDDPDAVLVPIGASAAITAQSIVNLINASPLAVKAQLSGQNVSLTHEIPYALGNQAIVKSGAAITAVSGMTGGVDGSFSAAYRTHFRVRNHPQSLRDGDVVVHEQLNYVIGLITATLTAFLRTDGGNQMVGPLNLGGQQALNAADATTDTGLVTKQQMDAAIDTGGEQKLSLTGLKDSVLEGTLTGPVTLGQLATAEADVDQTTTPADVVVHTLSGVPTPTANDQVANKLFVDESIAALVIGQGSIFASFDVEGDGLGGGGLATMVPGGEFYFEDLVISAAQSLTVPTRIWCSGTFTLQNTGSITSTGPVEIIAVGAVDIQGSIQCPHLTIRTGAAMTIAAAISSHAANGTYHKEYPFVAPSVMGYPVAAGTNELSGLRWRAILLDAVGPIVISAAMTSDDIFIKGGGNVTISSTITARWFVDSASWDMTGNNVDLLGWFDGYKNYAVNPTATGRGPGGTGGTGGGSGAAGTGVAGGDSIYKSSNRPYLLPNYALARGGFGGRNSPAGDPTGDGQHGRGGGRISVYADGNLTLTAAGFFATGGDGDDISGGGADAGGGGAGSVRLVCKGVMTDGAIVASGGDSNDNTGGGGGLAAMVASSFVGTQSRDVTAGSGVAGTSVAVTMLAATINGLKQQHLFEIMPNG